MQNILRRNLELSKCLDRTQENIFDDLFEPFGKETDFDTELLESRRNTNTDKSAKAAVCLSGGEEDAPQVIGDVRADRAYLQPRPEDPLFSRQVTFREVAKVRYFTFYILSQN